MKIPRTLIVWGLIGTTSSLGWAADKPKAYFPVKISIQADVTTTHGVYDSLTRELSKLNDVDVTEDPRAGWLLYLNVIPLIDKRGLEGYIVSTVIADQYTANTLAALPSDDFSSSDVQRTVKDLARNNVVIDDHLVETCAPQDLPKVCAKLVSYFDV